MAKIEGREKPTKIGQRKVRGLEWQPQVEETALLASPVYIGQAQEGRRKKRPKGPVSLCLLSVSACPHASRMYFTLFSKYNWAVTRSYNADLSESCDTVCPRAEILFVWEPWHAEGFNISRFTFLLWQDRIEEITHSPDTTLKLFQNNCCLKKKLVGVGRVSIPDLRKFSFCFCS